MARLLFVDDEKELLNTLKKAVEMFGHQALLASSEEQAMSIALAECPDLIFVDMMLAETDGLSIVRQLKLPGSPSAQIPVVVLSAGPELDAGELAQQAGALDYLLKPVRLQTLLDTIHRLTS